MAWETFKSNTENYENSTSFVLPGFGSVWLAAISKCEWSLCFINRKMRQPQSCQEVQTSVPFSASVLGVSVLCFDSCVHVTLGSFSLKLYSKWLPEMCLYFNVWDFYFFFARGEMLKRTVVQRQLEPGSWTKLDFLNWFEVSNVRYSLHNFAWVFFLMFIKCIGQSLQIAA